MAITMIRFIFSCVKLCAGIWLDDPLLLNTSLFILVLIWDHSDLLLLDQCFNPLYDLNIEILYKKNYWASHWLQNIKLHMGNPDFSILLNK